MKRLLILLLTLFMITSLLTGCTAKEDQIISIDSIAKLNNLEADDLNVIYNDEGYLTFIDAKLSNSIVTNEEEALTFIKERAYELLELGDTNLTYYSTYASPNTEITYYRFQETLNGSYGQLTDAPMEYLVNGIKLGIDKEGYPVCISSDIDRSQSEFDTSEIISVDDAENIVKEMYPDITVYSDNTGICVWNDKSAKTLNPIISTKVLSYMVYGDNPDYANDNSLSPYFAYLVRAKESDGMSGAIIATLACDYLGEYSKVIDNTSLKFFDDKEDVGMYSYTISLDWLSEKDKPYALATEGKDSMEVSVPVMYCSTDGLYYLGEKEHYISANNYYDFMNSGGALGQMNFYVTDNPDDLSSWHFQKADSVSYDSEGNATTITYFDDADYVISSFAEYYRVVEEFGTRFKMFESYPDESYMLGLYLFMVNGYPKTLQEFAENAANSGQFFDWNLFVTSPASGMCLDSSIMCHEFTHGVNNHFTDARYANEQGALMESYADMVGYQMASMFDDKTKDWNICGVYSRTLRNLADPLIYGKPKYLNGLCYIPEMTGYLAKDIYMDYGGVHSNSGVPNYLGYCFLDGEKEEGEENLTMEEGLNLWFETLYVSTYESDFVSLGGYLKYAAEKLNYSDAKVTLIRRYIKELGFDDHIVDEKLLEEESTAKFTVNVTYSDTISKDKCDIGLAMINSEGLVYMVLNDYENSVNVTHENPSYVIMFICAYDENGNVYRSYVSVNPKERSDITLNINKLDLKKDDVYTFPSEEEVISMDMINGTNSSTVDTSIAHQLYGTIVDGSDEEVYNIYLVEVTE